MPLGKDQLAPALTPPSFTSENPSGFSSGIVTVGKEGLQLTAADLSVLAVFSNRLQLRPICRTLFHDDLRTHIVSLREDRISGTTYG